MKETSAPLSEAFSRDVFVLVEGSCRFPETPGMSGVPEGRAVVSSWENSSTLALQHSELCLENHSTHCDASIRKYLLTSMRNYFKCVK